MKYLVLLLILVTVPCLAQREIKYTRDKNGRVTRVEYPNGRAIVYTYDASGNLVRREHVVPEQGESGAAEGKKERTKEEKQSKKR